MDKIEGCFGAYDFIKKANLGGKGRKEFLAFAEHGSKPMLGKFWFVDVHFGLVLDESGNFIQFDDLLKAGYEQFMPTAGFSKEENNE